MVTKHICFITAVYGRNYQETYCKPFVSQTIPTNFICFTDNPDVIANGWLIDTNIYHDKTQLDIKRIIKFYKMQWYKIPILQDYEIVVWIDSDIEIISKHTSEIIINKLEKNKIICWHHPLRYGQLQRDAFVSSGLQKYANEDIMKQYQKYIEDGYDDNFFKHLHNLSGACDPNNQHLGVWLTNFIAFLAKDNITHEFLDIWYQEIVNYTTQDRISFS